MAGHGSVFNRAFIKRNISKISNSLTLAACSRTRDPSAEVDGLAFTCALSLYGKRFLDALVRDGNGSIQQAMGLVQPETCSS